MSRIQPVHLEVRVHPKKDMAIYARIHNVHVYVQAHMILDISRLLCYIDMKHAGSCMYMSQEQRRLIS